jgi:hypothetical protein
MLLLCFELLDHLQKRPLQLGQGKNKATRTHRPRSKDLNLTKKTVLFLFFGRFSTRTTGKVSKRFFNYGRKISGVKIRTNFAIFSHKLKQDR